MTMIEANIALIQMQPIPKQPIPKQPIPKQRGML